MKKHNDFLLSLKEHSETDAYTILCVRKKQNDFLLLLKEHSEADAYFKESSTASQYFSQAAALQSAYGSMSHGKVLLKQIF